MYISELSTPPTLRHASDLYQSSGKDFIPLWIQYLPDPSAVMAQHGVVSEFAHHPTTMAKVESQGPFAGETKLDAWLFKHSKFLRAHFKNDAQHTEANTTVFEHEDRLRHRSETTGSAESTPNPAQVVEDEGRLEHEPEPENEHDHEQEDEIQVGEEAPGHAVTSVRDVNLQKGRKLRRGSARKRMKWAFW
jgi:hypothetical protein